MTGAQPTAAPGTVRNVSDTARWAAYFRAQETARPDALFRDRFAERLCGQHGVDIANTLPDGNKHAWAWVTRTYLFDHFIKQELQQGTDLVLNLAAGLDARPDRKSTRLNSSHGYISYAVFCLKKKKKQSRQRARTRRRDPPRGPTSGRQAEHSLQPFRVRPRRHRRSRATTPVPLYVFTRPPL